MVEPGREAPRGLLDAAAPRLAEAPHAVLDRAIVARREHAPCERDDHSVLPRDVQALVADVAARELRQSGEVRRAAARGPRGPRGIEQRAAHLHEQPALDEVLVEDRAHALRLHPARAREDARQEDALLLLL